MSAQDPALERLPIPSPTPSPGVNSPNISAATVEGSSQVAVDTQDPVRRTPPWEALRSRDFRLYWAGGFVSQMGSQMRVVAVGVQMWDLTHSTTAVGLLGLFKLVPLLVLSIFGGVIADALDRRRLLMVTQTIMASSSVLLALATQFGWISPALVYGVSSLGAATLAFDNPARSALIPNLVPRRHLPNALSLNIIVWQVATIIGPVIGGVFLAMHAIGFAIIYWIDAVSFTAVLVALFFIRAKTQVAETRDVNMKAALDGLRFLRKAPIIMSTMTLDFFATFFGAASVLMPALAEQVLHLDRSLWGLLYAAPAIGAVVAGVIMSWFGNVRRQGIIVLVSVAAYGLATVVFGFSTFFLVTLLALAGTGAADTVSMVMRQTIRQLSTPDELRGRMTSVNMLFYMGGPQLGELEAGVAAAVIGIGPSIALGGLAVIVVSAVTGALVPVLRHYDRGE
ncbi:MAG: MFS transporter [Chloroflexota bacterium]|nr:MFS transporter [Chloroflexota bacterium]